MELVLDRFALKSKYTIGRLHINGDRICNTLEDPVRDKDKSGRFEGNEAKVYGDTAIPYGRYKVIVTYSPRFKRELPRLVDVPHFEGILIHSGNTEKDTEGCILPGENTVVGKVTNSKYWEGVITNKIKDAIANGEEVYITII